MRLIDADELLKDRVENDPVVIAANNEPTVSLASQLPALPIECAEMLINARYEQNSFGTGGKTMYSTDKLREIAEHLLIHCGYVEKSKGK